MPQLNRVPLFVNVPEFTIDAPTLFVIVPRLFTIELLLKVPKLSIAKLLSISDSPEFDTILSAGIVASLSMVGRPLLQFPSIDHSALMAPTKVVCA